MHSSWDSSSRIPTLNLDLIFKRKKPFIGNKNVIKEINSFGKCVVNKSKRTSQNNEFTWPMMLFSKGIHKISVCRTPIWELLLQELGLLGFVLFHREFATMLGELSLVFLCIRNTNSKLTSKNTNIRPCFRLNKAEYLKE